MNNEKLVTLPMLVIRGKVLFPNIYTNFDVTREKSVQAVLAAMTDGTKIFIAKQKNSFVEDPQPADIHRVGVICRIKKIARLGETNVRVFIEAIERAVIQYIESQDNYYKVAVISAPDLDDEGEEKDAYMAVAKTKLQEYTNLNKKFTYPCLHFLNSPTFY